MNHLKGLNKAQKYAVTYGAKSKDNFESGPLLVIAGAGTGKTSVLAHRVAHLVLNGVDPGRILLLTFTNQAATEMKVRVSGLLSKLMPSQSPDLPWAGTFHAIGLRLILMHADHLGLPSAMSVHDRDESVALMDLIVHKNENGHLPELPSTQECVSIYSWWINSASTIRKSLKSRFSEYADYETELTSLFSDYIKAKMECGVLDFDDLLLYWRRLLSEPEVRESIRTRFDHVLVDEYQDTNHLQANILYKLKPDGCGLTVVGDDAQAIYSFRAATVENILHFPKHFRPDAKIIKLERNYRSTQAILKAANHIMAQAKEGFAKELFSKRKSGRKPELVTLADGNAEARFVVRRMLRAKKEGLPFASHVVLFRSSRDSAALEMELSRKGIPFQKHGGQRLLDAGHIKDCLSVLRWTRNPADQVNGLRCLQLLPGIGKTRAQEILVHLRNGKNIRTCPVPTSASAEWKPFAKMVKRLRSPKTKWPRHISLLARWYSKLLSSVHDDPKDRLADVRALSNIATSYETLDEFVAGLLLEPVEPGVGAGCDNEDFVTLSTIHSAKGKEWPRVFVLGVIDGRIPHLTKNSSARLLEEERRLLYVAMTRAKNRLTLIVPSSQIGRAGPHASCGRLARQSRFLPKVVERRFQQRTWPRRAARAQMSSADDYRRRAVAREIEIRWRPAKLK